MIKTTLISLLLLRFVPSLFDGEGYTIKGTISGDYNGYIYLSYSNTKDSVLVKNNTFEFNGNVDKPIRAWLNLEPPANVAWVYLENSRIVVDGKYSTTIKDNQTIHLYRITSIKGSYSQQLLDDYRAFCNANRDKENFNTLRFQQLKLMFTSDPKQPVNGWILGDLAVNNPVFTYEEFIQLYTLLDTTAMRMEDIAFVKAGLRNMNKYGTGQQFVAFELINNNNVIVTSPKYSGKVIFVDFWASWCAPCREKHPALIDLLKKYQSKNFTVISLSIDKDTNAWRKAIEKDNLTWENLIDPEKKILNELGIQAIPFSYLIDEKGYITCVNQPLEKVDIILQEKLK
ncbi:MAG: TlpA disulfide reductase family protein [Cyclobacteriaceae bacterium]